MPASAEELKALIWVSGTVAAAWFLVALIREITRWVELWVRRKEFDARKEERVIKAGTEQAKVLLELVQALAPNVEPPKSTADLVATLLRSTADHIKSQAK